MDGRFPWKFYRDEPDTDKGNPAQNEEFMCSHCYGCVRLGKTLQFCGRGSSLDICSYFRWERCEDSVIGAHVTHFRAVLFGRQHGAADEIDTIGISLDYKFAFNAAVHRID
jgi:hypothetical protein